MGDPTRSGRPLGAGRAGRPAALLLILALLAGTGAGATAAGATAAAGAGAALASARGPSLTKLLGQRIMIGFSGRTPTPALLTRVRLGQVGAVILFAANIASRAQVHALVHALQGAARAGGNPPLLISVDQEGGQIRRFAGGPPYLSPPQMAATGKVSTARQQGTITGRYLAGLGVNMDLAPVSDVPTSTSSFIWQEGRAFSFNAATVAADATAFALGVQSAHVAATAKHFPGVGSGTIDTDYRLDYLTPTARQRAAALMPYRSLIPAGVDAIMVATGAFPAYDPSGIPAALSSRIIGGLLRGRLHFRGVAITDALESPTGHDETTAGVLAAEAGADILLYTDPASGELQALERASAHGRLSRANALAAYNRIVALKRQLIPAR